MKEQILKILKEELFSSYDEGNIENDGIIGGEQCAEKLVILFNQLNEENKPKPRFCTCVKPWSASGRCVICENPIKIN